MLEFTQGRLQLHTHGVALEALSKMVPPSLGSVGRLTGWRRTGDHTAEVAVRSRGAVLPGTKLISSFAALTEMPYAFQTEVRLSADSREDHLFLVGIGSTAGYAFNPTSTAGSLATVSVDVLQVDNPVSALEVIVHIAADDIAGLLRAPAILAVQLYAEAHVDPAALPRSSTSLDVVVPAISQMTLETTDARRICSPTNVAMVLHGLGRCVPPLQLARQAYSEEHDMYGVWPANIWAASRNGALGYVAHLSDWGQVIAIIESGLPIVASIGYEAGELSGAAIQATAGHLVTIRGIGEGVVKVNDPAAESDDKVAREYDIGEFNAVWLQRRGIAYVFTTGLAGGGEL